MIPLDKCKKYSGEIKRLTKSSSTIVAGRVIYIVKKDHEQKASRLYIAYDYKTKVQLAFHKDKDYLIEFLKTKEEEIKGTFNE